MRDTVSSFYYDDNPSRSERIERERERRNRNYIYIIFYYIYLHVATLCCLH